MDRKYEVLSLAASALAMALVSALLIAIGVGQFRVGDFVVAFSISAPAILVGRTLGHTLCIPRRPGFIFSFDILAGYAAFSLLVLSCTEIFRLDVLQSFFVSVAIVIALFSWKGLLSATDIESLALPNCVDLAIVPIIAVLVAIWDHSTLTCLRDAEKSGIFLGWKDLMVHSTQISYLRGFQAFAGQSMELARTPQYFYHRGSYALAAVFAAMTGRESLQVATCYWQPLGLILMGLGAYSYATALQRRAAGMAAVIALFLLPDAAMYWFRNGFFGFHWLVIVSPASGYGIAIVFLAFAAFILGISAGRFDLVLIGWFFALSTFAFKVQVAFPAALLYAILGFITWRPARGWYRAITFLIFCAVFSGIAAVCEHISFAPHFLSGEHDALRFFQLIHSQKSQYSAYWATLVARSGPTSTVLAGIVLLLVAAFGAALPASIVVAAYRMRRGGDWRIEAIPLGLLAAYLAMIFGLPTMEYGDYTEFSHRPFVLIYAFILVTTVVGLSGVADELCPRHPRVRLSMFAAIWLLALIGTVSAVSAGSDIQLSWGTSAGLSMPQGLQMACGYIRAHSHGADNVLSSDGDPRAVVAALSERPSFLSRGKFFRLLAGTTGNIADSRVRLLADLHAIKDYRQLQDFGRAHEIQWYLLCRRDRVTAGPELLKNCVWSVDGYYVFDLR